MQSFHLHLVSDATGETCITIARAAAAQFQGVESVEHLWSLVRTESQLRRVLVNVEAEPGVVMFTLVDPALRGLLLEECRRIDVPCIPLLDTAISALSGFLGVESRNQPGRQHVMDAAYLKRIDAMNYALGHDDGRSSTTLRDADIVLVGVSRTSKTPTCFYPRQPRPQGGERAGGSRLPPAAGVDDPDGRAGGRSHLPSGPAPRRPSQPHAHDRRGRRDRLRRSGPGRGGGCGRRDGSSPRPTGR